MQLYADMVYYALACQVWHASFKLNQGERGHAVDGIGQWAKHTACRAEALGRILLCMHGQIQQHT